MHESAYKRKSSSRANESTRSKPIRSFLPVSFRFFLPLLHHPFGFLSCVLIQSAFSCDIYSFSYPSSALSSSLCTFTSSLYSSFQKKKKKKQRTKSTTTTTNNATKNSLTGSREYSADRCTGMPRTWWHGAEMWTKGVTDERAARVHEPPDLQ